MALKNVESRLERLFDRALSRSLRSPVQPIEMAQRIAREIDLNSRVGNRDTLAPNDVKLFLSDEDAQRFSGFEKNLVLELAESVREHALREGYNFVGPVAVNVFVDEALALGQIAVKVDFVQGQSQPRLIDAVGTQYPISERPLAIGRTPENDVIIADQNVSRRHAEVWLTKDGVAIRDLGSTNGTLVNGRRIDAVLLSPQDEIVIGSMPLRIEMA
jgi:hypothetical protein